VESLTVKRDEIIRSIDAYEAKLDHTLNSLMNRKVVRCVGWQKLAKRKPVRIWVLP
jgi:hypothetical protein